MRDFEVDYAGSEAAKENEGSYELSDVAFGDLAFNASHSATTSCLSRLRSANIFSKEVSSAALS